MGGDPIDFTNYRGGENFWCLPQSIRCRQVRLLEDGERSNNRFRNRQVERDSDGDVVRECQT